MNANEMLPGPAPRAGGREQPSWLRSRLVRARVLQILLLAGLWQVGEFASRGLGLPIPGSVFALFLTLILLAAGWLPLNCLHHGAQWLIGEMLLFFVPPLMALRDYPQFWGLLGLKLLAAIVIGIVAVMGATALTVEVLVRMGACRRIRPHA